ncbi:ribonuclease P protein component [Candidatus Parcubacteria bacterium]|nr:ribonuclease P protein component [Candidatus Parcubacteria bacterium]
MLAKGRRIPRSLFPSLLNSRRFAHSTHFSLRFAPGETTRVAVSVSKKVSKSAVERNAIRRRVYAALSTKLDKMPKGFFLFVAKAGAQKIRGQKLQEELAALEKTL